LVASLLYPTYLSFTSQFYCTDGRIHLHPEVDRRSHLLLTALDNEYAIGADVAGNTLALVD
jgi:hypothetical protein